MQLGQNVWTQETASTFTWQNFITLLELLFVENVHDYDDASGKLHIGNLMVIMDNMRRDRAINNDDSDTASCTRIWLQAVDCSSTYLAGPAEPV